MSIPMKNMWSVGALTLATAIQFGGCSTGLRATVFIPGPPPLAIQEVRIAPPGVGYVWIRGHHQWVGGAYVWAAGRWERPPRARGRWQEGHWRHTRQGWYWAEGRWR